MVSLLDDEKRPVCDPDFGDDVSADSTAQKFLKKVSYVLTRWGIETNGIDPIPSAERSDTRLYQMFFVWFSANINILSFGTGSAGPAFYGLGLRESIVVLLIVDIITCAIPAYFAVFGPKLGLRSMVQARFSWGYYPAILPSALNVFSMQGFLILNCIIGGQTLAAVSHHLDDTLGIVIVGLISLAGYVLRIPGDPLLRDAGVDPERHRVHCDAQCRG
ncbi:hypothetical protein SCP_1100670 [Sparassis crispa]|uniref:Purine-cytosine permease fcyB n=1 Tax=Sparassis crispa TaxID=139825 RepID=A0A401GZ09_9APHY|nr:hypothetical protein SCP_1100670 [Sparassis crispa]GBE87392.1 hypothetical protein SCP_1100670 [Sparassis crispa]